MIGRMTRWARWRVLPIVLASVSILAVAVTIDEVRAEAAVNAEAVRDAADAALRVAEDHPESFGAITLSDRRAEVVIYRVEPAPALDAALDTLRSSLSTGITVTIRACPFSRRELATLSQQLEKDVPALRSSGVDVRSWGPEPDASGLAIGVRGSSAEASAALASRYGSHRIKVTEAPRAVFLPYQFPTGEPAPPP